MVTLGVATSIDGPAGWLLLTLPWLALVLVVGGSGRGRRQRTREQTAAAVAVPLGAQKLAGLEEAPSPAALGLKDAGRRPEIERPEIERPAAPVVVIDPVAAAAQRILDEARQTLAAGKLRPAAELLRETVRMASKANLPVVHAAARLELAEIARIDGDLTTACEHWQIARGLYHDTKLLAERDEISERMRDHRCPTDWVLTNF